MRFLRVGPAGSERPAVLDTDGLAYDLTSLTADIDGAFLAGDGVERAREALAGGALPRIDIRDNTIAVNGLYRHGFLLAPAMAQQAADMIFERTTQRELAHAAHH